MHEFKSWAQRLPLELLPHHELMMGELRAAPPTALLLPLALQEMCLSLKRGKGWVAEAGAAFEATRYR